MLQRTLVPSFFLSLSVSSLFCIRPIYVKFHVIYQVKGVSRYVWGVCGCVQVCMGMPGCVGVGLGMCGSVQVCAYTHGVHRYGCVGGCGMNFQNTFWRLES